MYIAVTSHSQRDEPESWTLGPGTHKSNHSNLPKTWCLRITNQIKAHRSPIPDMSKTQTLLRLLPHPHWCHSTMARTRQSKDAQATDTVSPPPPVAKMTVSRLCIFYRFIWIYSDLFDKRFCLQVLIIRYDKILSCDVSRDLQTIRSVARDPGRVLPFLYGHS
jgi:hypothetical protein